MPALQVRDLPQDLYDALKLRADSEHRSMSQQTIVLLGKALLEREPFEGQRRVPRSIYMDDCDPDAISERIEKRKRIFSEIRAIGTTEAPVDFPSIEELIREDRDAR